MLLAVFSDSHGAAERMIAAVRDISPDAAVFLGDVTPDAEALRRAFPALPLTVVRGNCDGDRDYPDSALFDFGGVRIFAAHGHRHGVKLSLDGFATSTLCSGAALGLFGHTHVPLHRALGGIELLNPGTIGDPRRPTFALVEVENGAFSCRITDFG